MTTINVIIPIFNRAHIVHRAIDSVYLQDLPPGWKINIIAVDDGSSDSLEDVLRPYGTNVKILRHSKNCGAAAARNTGVAAADGDYVAFLDSDDVWLPGKLKKQIEFMRTNHFSLSCTAFVLVRADQSQIVSPSYPTGELGLSDYAWGCYVSPGSTLICERNIFDEVGLFDVFLRRLEDWDFLLRFVRLQRAGFLAQPLARIEYSTHHGSEQVLAAIDLLRSRHAHHMSAKNRQHFLAALEIERAAAYYREGSYLSTTLALFRSLLFVQYRHLGIKATLHNKISRGIRENNTAQLVQGIGPRELARANFDRATISSFGREWTLFRQSEAELPAKARERIFYQYFDIFPWQDLPPNSVGLDLGCGSGRFALMAAPRVGQLHAVDISPDALSVARNNLSRLRNVIFHEASVENLPLADASLDFVYSLGVLHHVPDTAAAICSVAKKLKPGGLFLLYLYYALDGRPYWYKLLWRLTDLFRLFITKLPSLARYAVSQTIALVVYYPLSRFSILLELFGIKPQSMPLQYYKDLPFYVMRTDAYDRFCTPLEKRFTKSEIVSMLSEAGFKDIRFSDHAPFWCSMATRES